MNGTHGCYKFSHDDYLISVKSCLAPAYSTGTQFEQKLNLEASAGQGSTLLTAVAAADTCWPLEGKGIAINPTAMMAARNPSVALPENTTVHVPDFSNIR